jgi:hypothetical protein
MMNNMNDNELNRVVRVHQAIKKEEEEQEHDNDDEENKKTTQAIPPKSIHGTYDDWKNGNWCWLLPAKRNANGKTRQKRKSSDNCTKPTNSVKSEDDIDTNNNDSATPEIKIAATTSTAEKKLSDGDGDGDDDDDDNDDDDDDESNKPSPPKKKMRRCRLPINDIVNKENEEGEEEDCVYATYDEANNNTTNDNKDDDDDDDDEEKGYESWTEGNWCLLLPFSSTVVDNIETTRPATTPTSRRRRAVVRNCNSSPDDGNDDISSAKSNKRKSTTIRYDRWQNERWDEMFQRLVAYKKVHKSTTVPERYAEDPKLATWVQTQRRTCGKKNISVKRIGRLDSIGFVWKINDLVPWEEIYKRLVAYKKKHKSTNVPWMYEADPKLGLWVSKQRQFYNSKTLSIERINRLELISFVWDPFGAQWMEMYHKLLAYKKENNSTKVPFLYTKDPSLGIWVYTQRIAYNNGKMSGKRLELLNSINFVWSAKK